jgi:hypothetical protein
MDAPGRTADVFAWQRSALDSATSYTTGVWRMWSDAVNALSDGNGSSKAARAQRETAAETGSDPGGTAEGLGSVVLNRVLRSSRIYMQFAEFWIEFLKDVPILGSGRSESVFGRWAKLYGGLFEQLVGSPPRQAKAAFPWMGFPGVSPTAFTAMWSPWWSMLGKMPQQMFGGVNDPGRASDPVSLWGEVLNETMGQVFATPPAGLGPPAEFARRSQDAFMRFSRAVPSIYRLFYTAGLDALREFLTRVGETGLEAIASKPLREVYRMWWTANEDAFLKIFQMPEFGKALNEVMTHSLEVKQQTDSMAADWCKKASLPTRADFDEMAATVHELRRTIRHQEQDIQSLQDELGSALRRKRRTTA